MRNIVLGIFVFFDARQNLKPSSFCACVCVCVAKVTVTTLLIVAPPQRSSPTLPLPFHPHLESCPLSIQQPAGQATSQQMATFQQSLMSNWKLKVKMNNSGDYILSSYLINTCSFWLWSNRNWRQTVKRNQPKPVCKFVFSYFYHTFVLNNNQFQYSINC